MEGLETFKYTNDDGVEIEVAPVEKVQEVLSKKDADLKALADEKAKIERVSAEKTENFKKLNEMTQEERDAHTVNELNLLKRNEAVEAELAEIKTQLTQKEERERASAKVIAMDKYHVGNEDVKKTLEENYAKLGGMPEGSPEEVRARVAEAAKLSGISINSQNPLYADIGGDAPMPKDKKEFIDTDSGKQAADMVRDALGVKKS